IRARPPTLVDRVRQWARRHKPAVTAGVLVLAVALIAATVTAVMVTQERADAEIQPPARAQEAAFAPERDLLARRHAYLWDLLNYRTEPRQSPTHIQAMLAQHVPRPGQEDVRGFEWYLLRRLWQGDPEALRTLVGHEGEVFHVTFSPDGKTL